MKYVVITGASKGIGFATAKMFAQNGDKVLITSRNNEHLQHAKNAIGENIYTFVCDSSETSQIEQLANYIFTEFGGCDILINNAGVFVPGSIHTEPNNQYKQMMKTNVDSAYLLTKAILPSMISNQSGDIVNICSIASNTPYPNGGSYSISKYALFGFSKNLREELKSNGIRVISVLPGATFTASWEGAAVDEQRLMPAEDIATLIVTACSLSRRSVVEEIIVRPQLGDL